MVELAQQFDAVDLADIVFHKMGLLALSDGISAEMTTLLKDNRPAAQFAIAYFCRQACAAIGSLAAKAGGIDALVFTGGIGEHAPTIRAAICEPLGFLGITLDAEANRAAQSRIDSAGSRPVLVIPADEEKMIFDLVTANLQTGNIDTAL
jgi:acetate kinase